MNYLKTTLFATLALCAVAFASCDPEKETVAVTGVEITSTPSPLVLAVGGATGKVEAKVLPADATDKTIAWSAAPEGVVTVAADGTVTAVAPGTATITATAKNGVKGTCSVTVAERAVDSYTGTLLVKAGAEDEFTLENVEVTFTVADDKTTVDIELLKVKFAEAMKNELDVLIPGVTLTKTTDGYTVSCGEEGIVPTAMNGIEFAAYIFTEIEGSVTATTLSLEMKSGGDPMSFEGTATPAAK